MFDELMVNIKTEICRNIFLSASSLIAFEQFFRNLPQRTVHAEASAFGSARRRRAAAKSGPATANAPATWSPKPPKQIARARAPVRAVPKVGRNDPCPCGSGKKYKQCCGR